MAKNRVITVQGIPVTVSYEDIDDFICITDIAAAKSDNSRAADVIRNWLRNRSTLEFLSTCCCGCNTQLADLTKTNNCPACNNEGISVGKITVEHLVTDEYRV